MIFLPFFLVTLFGLSAICEENSYFQIQNSAYQNIQSIDYGKIKTDLDQLITVEEPRSFRTNTEGRRWVENQILLHPENIQMLPITRQTLADDFLSYLDQRNPQAIEIFRSFIYRREILLQKPIETLYGFRIFNKSPLGKRDILIWAKEHGDEMSTSEFVLDLSEFLLNVLSSDGSGSYLAAQIQRIFENVNLVILPNMTPDIQFDRHRSEDRTWFGLFLQPFDFDTQDPVLLSAAPEVQFFKEVVNSLDSLALAVDLHNPFGVATHTLQHPDVLLATKELIAEAEFVKECSRSIWIQPVASNSGDQSICKSGRVQTEYEISPSIRDSASYVSRIKKIPSIFLELGCDPNNHSYSILEEGFGSIKNCGIKYQDRSYHLTKYLPFFMRLMEIVNSKAF